jgi:hypothetical protein
VFETANSRYVPLADLEPAIEKEQEACLQN